jgi:hypothetical protein
LQRTTNTENTQPAPHPQEPRYLYGLSSGLELLASTIKNTDEHPKSRVDTSSLGKKRFFLVEVSHDIVRAWETLEGLILQQVGLEAEGWRSDSYVQSIHCVQIGYEFFPLKEAPVLILLMVRGLRRDEPASGEGEGAGEGTPTYAHECQQLALALQDQEKYEEAEEMNRRALEG